MFWVSWLLMPGVGITDTATILALVRENRSSVFISVILQLVSAAMYAPGLCMVLVSEAARKSITVQAGGILLLIGAMGSASDAIFHLVAYEMTAPGITLDAVSQVMQRLQGNDPALLLPFVGAFFIGHALLVGAMRKSGALARFGFLVLVSAAPAILLVGVPIAHLGILSGRSVGLGFLAVVSGSLAILGLSTFIEGGPSPVGSVK